MNKPELLEYLKTVCEAEEALYACKETNVALKQELENKIPTTVPVRMALPQKPDIPPKCRSTNRFQEHGGGFRVISTIVSVAGFFIGGTIAIHLNLEGWSFLFSLIGALLGFIICNLIPDLNTYFAEKEQDRLNEENYRWQMQKYNSDIDDYNEQIQNAKHASNKLSAVEDKRVSAVREAIAENELLGERIQQSLSTLYDKGIIYPTFRNLVAVHQIYEYIAMGVCETLEGATGAYSIYLSDLRAKKICDSIIDLKNTMATMMDKIAVTQGLLLQEMQVTNKNIQSLQQSVHQDMSEIHAKINVIGRTTGDLKETTENQLANINERVNELRDTLKSSAHNEYVHLREKNIKGYLLKHP